MPRLVNAVPKLRRHASGQAVVTLCGKDYYLDLHGTKASRAQYSRLIAEWEANDRQPIERPSDLTITELCAAYWRFAKRWYVKNGRPTDEQACIKGALKPLKKLYGPIAVVEFGPKALKAVQEEMVAMGRSRGYINKSVSRIRRMFRWAVAEELAPASILHALQAVDGLRKGKTPARETSPVTPVDDAVIDATIKHLNRTAADMVRLQRMTGARPGEICILRPCDVDRSNAVWEYRPESHKTEHRGRERVVYIGPKAQAILIVYLMRTEPEKYCFRPWRKPNHPRYTVSGYRTAIWIACKNARVDKWSPNKLRHAAATEVRKRFGLEGAQVTLGHSKADVTQIYAERNTDLARQVAREVG